MRHWRNSVKYQCKINLASLAQMRYASCMELEQKRLNIRIPEELHKLIRLAAAKRGDSVQEEVYRVLDHAYCLGKLPPKWTPRKGA